MKKVSLWFLFILCFMTFVGCQSTNPESKVDSSIFIDNFAKDFLTLNYDSNMSNQDYLEIILKATEPYFTTEGYKEFQEKGCFFLPLDAVIENKANLSVNSVDLEILFKDKESIGYIATMNLNVHSTETSESLEISPRVKMSLKKENSYWKINSIEIRNEDVKKLFK